MVCSRSAGFRRLSAIVYLALLTGASAQIDASRSHFDRHRSVLAMRSADYLDSVPGRLVLPDFTGTNFRGTIFIAIVLDDYPEETTWELVNRDTDELIASGGPYDNQPGELILVEVTVDDGVCHRFTIFDTFGDGICCFNGLGSYSVTYNGETVCSGGEFEFQETCDFIGESCVIPVGACCIELNCEVLPGSDGAVTEAECAAFAGQFGFDYEWYEGESCPEFVCPPPPTGACCVYEDGVLVQCVTSDEAACLQVDGLWFEEQDCFGNPPFECPADPCGPETLYTQAVGGTVGIPADERAFGGFIAADNLIEFSGEIEQLSWFGMNRVFDGTVFRACEKEPELFQIVVFADDGTQTPDVDHILCGPYTVQPLKWNTGDFFNDSPIWRYDAVIAPSCVVTTGWVGVFGLDNGEDSCWFLWHSSLAGDGGAYWWPEGTPPEPEDFQNVDLSMCILGEYVPIFGACCDDEVGVCTEDVEVQDCPGPLRHAPNALCADFSPVCGEAPGACCHIDGTCDVVDEAGLCVGADDLWLGRNTFCDDCPCRLSCPAGAELEDEVCGQSANGGCSGQPGNIPQPITLGTPICGQAWAQDDLRDTDWYRAELLPGEYTFTVEAEYPVAMGLIEYNPDFEGSGNCNEITGEVNPFATAQGCEDVSVTFTIFDQGTYWVWVSVDGFEGVPCRPDFGNNYVALLDYETPPCFLDCSPQSVPEGEPDCEDQYVDVTNGGCNSEPPVFSSITLGEPVCGRSGTYFGIETGKRDTDWYEIVLTQETVLTVEVISEFPIAAGVVRYLPGFEGSGDCSQITGISPIEFADPCENGVAVSTCLMPGTWWVFVAPQGYIGVPCGAEYDLLVTGEVCGELCPYDLDNNGAVGPGDVGIVKNAFGCDVNEPACAALDFDENHAVGPGDVGVVKNAFGACP